MILVTFEAATLRRVFRGARLMTLLTRLDARQKHVRRIVAVWSIPVARYTRHHAVHAMIEFRVWQPALRNVGFGNFR